MMVVMTQSWACPVVTGRVPEMIAILGLTGSVGSVTWNVSGPVWRIVGRLLKPVAQARTTMGGEPSHGWWPFSKAVWVSQNCRQLVMSQMPEYWAGPAGTVPVSLAGWNAIRRKDLPGNGTGVPFASCSTVGT